MRSLLVAALAPLLSAACVGPNGDGGGPVVADESPQLKPEGSYESAQGAMSDYDVEEAFKALHPSVVRCVNEGMARVEALGGELTLVLGVAPNGEVLRAHLKRSTLGDRDTEACVLAAARARGWPRPVGGDGTAEHTYGVDAAVEAKALDARRMRYVERQVQRVVARCAKGTGGSWQVTLYVRGNGKVVSVGVATPDAEADEHAACVADRVGQLLLPRLPRRWSKVTFDIP